MQLAEEEVTSVDIGEVAKLEFRMLHEQPAVVKVSIAGGREDICVNAKTRGAMFGGQHGCSGRLELTREDRAIDSSPKTSLEK